MSYAANKRKALERGNEIRAYLEGLPPPKHSPYSQENTSDNLSAINGIIVKLKGFVAFLSNLNPKAYLSWMLDAYSRFTDSLSDTSPEEETRAALTPEPAKMETHVSLPSKKAPLHRPTP